MKGLDKITTEFSMLVDKYDTFMDVRININTSAFPQSTELTQNFRVTAIIGGDTIGNHVYRRRYDKEIWRWS